MKGISSPPSAGLKFSGVVVLDNVAVAGEWEDLDLSPYVGAKVALCYIKVVCNIDGPDNGIYTQPKGEGGLVEDYMGEGGKGNVSVLEGLSQDNWGYIVVSTDSSGIIEMFSNDLAQGWTFKLICFI